MPMLFAGGFCVVFPFINKFNKKLAVRCWIATIEKAEYRTREIAASLSNLSLPYFLEFKYIPQAILTSTGVQPVVCMEWVEAVPLKQFIGKHIRDRAALNAIAQRFLEMAETLHTNKVSHGDLQHDNILVKNDGSLILVDYDSMYVPALEGEPEEIKGLQGYQHPERKSNKFLTSKADYFSELVIYLSIITLAVLPHLWESGKMKDTETLLFSAKDLESPENSRMFKILADCSNETVRKISAALHLACLEKDILSLLPLESVLKDINRMPWEGKQAKEIPMDSSLDPLSVIKKFGTNRQQTPPMEFDTSSVTKKF